MRRAVFLGLVLAVVFAPVAGARDLAEVAAGQEAKLEASLERLRELRETIHVERLPMVRELNALEARAAELEAEVEKSRRARDSRSVELETLRARVVAAEKEMDYVFLTLLPSYLADFEASLSIGEKEGAGEAIREYHLFLETDGADELAKLERGLGLVGESLAQVDGLLGGKRYAGKALTPSGTVEAGSFVQVGPLLYFSDESGSVAGVVESTRALDARVVPLEGAAAGAIAAVAKNGEGRLPVDLSLGDAVALAQTKDTVMEHLVKGGIWVVPILLFGLVATVVAVVKCVQIFRIRQPQPMAIHGIVQALRAGKTGEARELAGKQPEPARGMLLAAVEHADESTEMVEEVMYEAMLTTQPRLERFLNVIAVTAAAAPLLGLLGTVTGIIKTFGLMTIFGAGDPRPLISGISEALITTELGLIVAIPALVMHALLSRKVAGTMARMEKTAVTFVNGLSRSKGMKAEGAAAV